MLSKGAHNLGFRSAPDYYINLAMDFYRSKYSNPQFIICTDDRKWVQQHINWKRRDIHLIQTDSAVGDMALLSQCNHSIMTVGE